MGDREQTSDISEPVTPEPNHITAQVFAEIAAQIHQYTERPDLFFEVIEKYSPGFIEEMIKNAKADSGRMREQRFRFGRFQAYAALLISILAALTLLGSLVFLIDVGQASFWTIIAIAIFYAVTQGGPKGFASIIAAFGPVITSIKEKAGGSTQK